MAKFDLNSLIEQIPVESVGNDFILLEDISLIPLFDYPNKISVAVATICIEGVVEGSINLKPCRFSKNDFFILRPGQIVQFMKVSNDFSAKHIIMSDHFLKNLDLNIKDALLVSLHLRESYKMHLNNEEMESLLDFYNMLRNAVRRFQNSNRINVVRSLTQAMFYGINDFEQLYQNVSSSKSKKEVLFDSFYDLILKHYKDSREVGFYADKLFLSPKYLSSSIKEVTGRTAFEWINNYIILEAKSMLKSTGMTIQQISDELNFPNQSFFGKYFKQHVGLSPSAYRVE